MKDNEKEQEILLAIIAYITSHGYSPTVREIGDMVGLRSTSSTQLYIQRMIKKGLIESDAQCMPRAIRVPGYKFVQEEDHAG